MTETNHEIFRDVDHGYSFVFAITKNFKTEVGYEYYEEL